MSDSGIGKLDECPTLVRCEVTGESWQVAWWPEESGRLGDPSLPGGGTVLLKRGDLEREEAVDGFFENYTVVCWEQAGDQKSEIGGQVE